MRRTLAPAQTADMRERSWIALVLCLGCAPFSMPGARETGRPTTNLKGSQRAQIRAAVGSSVTLSCSFIYFGHIKDTRLGKFYAQNGRPTMSNDDIVKCRPHASKRVRLHCSFSSTITNIRPENETVYYCEVFISRSIGTTKVKGTGTTVTLYSEASSIRIRRPSQLASGSESVLTCKASGFYPRNVLAQWFHGDAPAPPGSVKDVIAAASDGTFSLLSSYAFRARARDHGVQCRCLVSHPTWARGRSANVTLDVGYGPGFVNVTSDPGPVTQGSLLLPAGSPLTFSCSADGNPRPETRWLGGNVTARHVGGTLQLAAVREEDEGTYWCVAKNLYGEKNASITLLVSQSQTSPGSLRLLALCVLGAVLMIFVFSLVCLLTKRMNRSPAHAQTLSDSRSEGALPPLSESQGASPDPIYSVLELSSKRARQREPVPHTVDESQPIYAEVKFPLASRNRNIMEATESTIYSTVIFRNA